MIDGFKEVFMKVYETTGWGINDLWDRKVIIAGAAMFVFNLVLSAGAEVFALNNFLNSSQIVDLTAGGIDTSAAFPLALTKSPIIGAAQILTGAIGAIVITVLLVRIFLEKDDKLTDHLHDIIVLSLKAIGMLGGIAFAVLALITVLAIPMMVLSEIAGQGALLLVSGIILIVLFYLLAFISMALPALVEEQNGIQAALRTSIGMVRSDQGYLLLTLLTAVVLNLLVGVIGQLGGNLYGRLHPLVRPLLANLATSIGLTAQWAILVEAYRRLQVRP